LPKTGNCGRKFYRKLRLTMGCRDAADDDNEYPQTPNTFFRS
jgi:hypothetical protein